jgi:hypothetical protein
LLQVSPGEPDKKAVVCYSELIASLAAALEEAPFELSDEASKPSRSRVYKFEFILNVALRVGTKESEY